MLYLLLSPVQNFSPTLYNKPRKPRKMIIFLLHHVCSPFRTLTTSHILWRAWNQSQTNPIMSVQFPICLNNILGEAGDNSLPGQGRWLPRSRKERHMSAMISLSFCEVISNKDMKRWIWWVILSKIKWNNETFYHLCTKKETY